MIPGVKEFNCSIFLNSGLIQHNFKNDNNQGGSGLFINSNKWIRIIIICAYSFPGILPALFLQPANASEITVPLWVSDNMILPAGIPFKISGMAEPRETMTVSFGTFSITTNTDDCGSWTIEFPEVTAAMKGELVFTCNYEKKIISDVATGDTWLCSGQSNMQRTIAHSDAANDAEKDILNLDIRCFDGKSWEKINSDNIKSFSAVAVYFAIEMASRQHLPLGIFIAARGGTSIDAWLPGEAFPDTESGRQWKTLANDPEVLKAAVEDQADFKPYGQHRLARWGLGRAVPSSIYEQLIKPFDDLPVRGVVWYQGESNAGSVEQAREYRFWLRSLISHYRNFWGNQFLPFVIIQLPSYDPGTPQGRKAWAVLKDMQSRVAHQTDYTEIVKIKELGDLKDIHPVKKKEVGIRAADAAWKLTHARSFP